jgi:hypothetical protein
MKPFPLPHGGQQAGGDQAGEQCGVFHDELLLFGSGSVRGLPRTDDTDRWANWYLTSRFVPVPLIGRVETENLTFLDQPV